MPTTFGNYTPAEVEDIKRESAPDGTDRTGRTANQVWELWCFAEMSGGRKPPMFCPKDVVAKVRRDL